MFCSNCGSQNPESARFCEKCGGGLGAASSSREGGAAETVAGTMRGSVAQPASAADKTYATGKSPLAAVLLSFIIPGVGQLYNGDSKKGGIMLAILVVSFLLISVGIGFLGVLGVWVWSMVDAYQVANRSSPLM